MPFYKIENGLTMPVDGPGSRVLRGSFVEPADKYVDAAPGFRVDACGLQQVVN